MQYLLTIYANEAHKTTMSKEEMGAYVGAYQEFTKGIITSGNYVGGEALEPSATATCVRVKEGKTLTTDGPFIETKEQLGGFYLVEAKDLDEAVEIAAKIPTAKFGAIEVRPILDYKNP